jgi:hypothetical protein
MFFVGLGIFFARAIYRGLSKYSLAILYFKSSLSILIQEVFMRISERSMTKIVLSQVKDWDSFQRILRFLL